MQQATVNLFADMGVQPTTLLAGLVAATASTDTTAPTSTITLAGAGREPAGRRQGHDHRHRDRHRRRRRRRRRGLDRRRAAPGIRRRSRRRTARPSAGPTPGSRTATRRPTIESRAVDDSGNLETPVGRRHGQRRAVPARSGAATLTNPADSGDASAIEVGVKFTTDTFGTVSGIRFYKVAGEHRHARREPVDLDRPAARPGDVHRRDQLRLAAGQLLEPGSDQPQHHLRRRPTSRPMGHYAQTDGLLLSPPVAEPDGGGTVDSPPLHALRSTEPTINGVYAYSSTPTFPTSTYQRRELLGRPVFSAGARRRVRSPASTATAGNAAAAVSWTAPSTGGPVDVLHRHAVHRLRPPSRRRP